MSKADQVRELREKRYAGWIASAEARGKKARKAQKITLPEVKAKARAKLRG